MIVWVNSRTKTEDYSWRTCAESGILSSMSSIDDGYEKWKFEDCVPWFGLVAFQDEATLFFGNLVTDREDSRGRPIFVHAALKAENSKDVFDLVSFVSSLLVREKELLPKWTAFFSEAFDKGVLGAYPDISRLSRKESSQETIGRFVYPREDPSARDSIAKRLCSGVNLSVPLAVGTTGRSGKGIFERVCRSRAAWQTAFFSSACSMKTMLQVAAEPPREIKSNTRVVAAAIGGAVLLVLFVAALGTCSRRNGVANSSRGGADDGTSISTNLQVIGGMVANGVTNAPSQEAAVTNASSTSRDGSGGYVTPATTNAPLQEVAVTNALLSSQKGLGGPVTSAVTNTLQQKEALTNSLKTASDGTGKRKTENE